jgi:hypothetical protein
MAEPHGGKGKTGKKAQGAKMAERKGKKPLSVRNMVPTLTSR